MSAIRNKQRLIHLYRYLMENTDDEHQATTNDLVGFLRQEDANASRKTVKDDIEVLVEEGVDIIVTKSFYNSYFVGSRKFEVPEIKLLVDGVAANKTISREKKEEIIRKLLSLLSVHQAGKIEKHLHYGSSASTISEQLYYTIDKISDAIDGKRKISFWYTELIKEGPREETKQYVITPIVIKSGNNHFYVCGWNEGGEQILVFRLDRMSRTKVLDEKGIPNRDTGKVNRFLNSLFDMETGELTDVTLECRDEMSGLIRERFGEDADIWRSTQESFYVRVPVSVSPAFYGWVFRFGGMIRIVSPTAVRAAYLKRAAEIIKNSASRQY